MWKRIQGWVILAVLVLGGTWAWRWLNARFLIPPVSILDVERGMESAGIEAGSSIWRLDRSIRRPEDLRHGEIILYRFPGIAMPGEDGLIPARVAGLPGDWIGFRDGVLLRNGQPVSETGWSPRRDGALTRPSIPVPRGHVYALFDDRVHRFQKVPPNHDSRELKPIPFPLVAGRVVYVARKP